MIELDERIGAEPKIVITGATRAKNDKNSRHKALKDEVKVDINKIKNNPDIDKTFEDYLGAQSPSSTK